jgi:hypothetical protein
MKLKLGVLTVFVAAFAGLIIAVGPASSAEPATPKCADNTDATTVTAGIAQMVGCWTDVTKDGVAYKAADLDNQPTYGSGDNQTKAVDMNGFLVGPATPGTRLLVNPKQNTVQSVSIANGGKAEIKMYSIGYPLSGKAIGLGSPFVLNFTTPNQGSMLLEDLRLGANQAYSGTLAGFSPVGDVETPIKLSEDGKGSMDLTVRLAGIFTLKGHPQSVTILIPSKVGEGSRVDGFELSLEEIDGIKLIKINSFEATYSADEKKLGGGATFSLPFMGDKGVSFKFQVENLVVTQASVGASGLKIPIGGAGMLTAINGGFGFKEIDQAFVLNLNAGATAEFGPEIPTPWGKVVPIEVSAALKIGKEGQNFYFLFDGGVKVFRLNVGSVYLKINTSSGVAFGFAIGVGFPSFSNNSSDPFYIGASVDGWVANHKFQFAGDGKVRLFGADIFEGRVLINDRAAGACWKVTWFDGGAVYEYGKDVQTFGVSCGLDRYKEAYPSATRSGVAAVSADRPRTLTTGDREVVLSARGQDGAPRFKLTSTDGRSFEVPRDKEMVRTKKYMIAVDKKNKVTHVAAGALANGEWTITPYANSTPIMGVRTGKALRPERIRANVIGKGLNRTLVWDSTGNPHTKLTFTEVLKDGSEQPILVTDKVKGRYRFKAVKGLGYGKRKLRAYVVHGGTPREVTIEDRYVVRRPGKLRAPRIVRAWRDVYKATAAWEGVPGAHGYVAEIAVKKNGKRISAYRRVVGPKKRKIVISQHPGGSFAIANVQALNADGVPGRTGSKRFRLAPPESISLKQAGRQSSRSAVRVGSRVKVRTICPINGHCQTRVLLKLGQKTIGGANFQQVPGTYRFSLIAPNSKAMRKRLAAGKLNHLKVIVRQHRTASEPAGSFGGTISGL